MCGRGGNLVTPEGLREFGLKSPGKLGQRQLRGQKTARGAGKGNGPKRLVVANAPGAVDNQFAKRETDGNFVYARPVHVPAYGEEPQSLEPACPLFRIPVAAAQYDRW